MQIKDWKNISSKELNQFHLIKRNLRNDKITACTNLHEEKFVNKGLGVEIGTSD